MGKDIPIKEEPKEEKKAPELTKEDIGNQIFHEALKMIFPDIEITIQDGKQSIGLHQSSRMGYKEDAIKFLEEKTGRGKFIDPFVETDGTPWISVANILSALGHYEMALDFNDKYLRILYQIQMNSKVRFHKGGPLFWLSKHYSQLGKHELACTAMCYAFIEDCCTSRQLNETPAYLSLQRDFIFSTSELKDLFENTISLTEPPLFPEEILIKWVLNQNSVSGFRNFIFPFNKMYIDYKIDLLDESGPEPTGKNLEYLVAYCFMTIPGFKVSHRALFKLGEIDIMISNQNPIGQPLKWIDDYILIECKDWRVPVGVPQFGNHLTKLMLSHTKIGMIVSRKGISGRGGRAYAARQQLLAYSQSDYVVLDILYSELKQISNCSTFLDFLQMKYEELRFSKK